MSLPPAPPPTGELHRPDPVVLGGGAHGTELGAAFHPYLRDCMGLVCPFASQALLAGAVHYAELRVTGRTALRAVARALAGYLAWFDGASRRERDEQPGLVVAFPGPAGPVLPLIAAAHEVVRPAVYARGCTSSLLHSAEAPCAVPAPFCVLRRIVPADLLLSMRVSRMFPVYYRLYAAEARRTRLLTADISERWNRACREHGLAP
ncbi:DUF6875 domain-containing protein [Streptomyces sp. NPDC002536]